MRRLSVLAILLLLPMLGALAGCDTLSGASAAPRYVVFFQQWSAQLDDSAKKSIAAAADWAGRHPAATLTVTGFADPDGSPAANKDISRLRAQMVIDTLVQDGVAPARIVRHAKGAVASAMDFQESRRVEVAFVGR